MRFISSKTHGMLDYMVAVLFLVSPWVFGFSEEMSATAVMLAIGILRMLYSICTDYEPGLFGVFSFRTHLAIDIISGIFLAASPWILGFAGYVFLPQLLLGIMEIGTSLMTHTTVGTHEPVHQGHTGQVRHAH